MFGTHDMEYSELEAQTKRRVESASDAARIAFAKDSIKILLEAAAPAITNELNAHERELLKGVFVLMDSGTTDKGQRKMDELLASTIADEVRAIEFDPDLTELFCSLDSLLKYRASGDPREIVRVAVSMINHLDYIIGGDNEHYAAHNMLGDKRMVDEVERQTMLLAAEPSRPA